MCSISATDSSFSTVISGLNLDLNLIFIKKSTVPQAFDVLTSSSGGSWSPNDGHLLPRPPPKPRRKGNWAQINPKTWKTLLDHPVFRPLPPSTCPHTYIGKKQVTCMYFAKCVSVISYYIQGASKKKSFKHNIYSTTWRGSLFCSTWHISLITLFRHPTFVVKENVLLFFLTSFAVSVSEAVLISFIPVRIPIRVCCAMENYV